MEQSKKNKYGSNIRYIVILKLYIITRCVLHINTNYKKCIKIIGAFKRMFSVLIGVHGYSILVLFRAILGTCIICEPYIRVEACISRIMSAMESWF